MDKTKRNKMKEEKERVLCHDVFHTFESKSQNEISQQWKRILGSIVYVSRPQKWTQ